MTSRRNPARAVPVLVFMLLAAIGLLGVADRDGASRPGGRRPVDRSAATVTLPVVVVLGDVRLPQDALTRVGRGEPGAATLGVDALAGDGSTSRGDDGWHSRPRAAGAHRTAAGAAVWRGRAPPHAGSTLAHA